MYYVNGIEQIEHGSSWVNLFRFIGSVYGKGVYFATEAECADGFSTQGSNGHKFMYHSKVLTGDFTNGSEGLRAPPPKDPNERSIKYDSVVDNTTNPRKWVIFEDYQAYPGYIIVYIKK